MERNVTVGIEPKLRGGNPFAQAEAQRLNAQFNTTMADARRRQQLTSELNSLSTGGAPSPMPEGLRRRRVIALQDQLAAMGTRGESSSTEVQELLRMRDEANQRNLQA